MIVLAVALAVCWIPACQLQDVTRYAGDRSDLARQNLPESAQLEFFMDSTSDCSPLVRETGDRSVVVYGRGAIQSGASPLTCEIQLRADTPLHPRKYKIGLQDMDIRDCNVQFYIYDGTKTNALLGRYGCPQNSETNYERVLWTSGSTATFYITRSSREQTMYSIRIWVQSISGNTDWDDKWPQNPDYDRFYKFEQKWVTLIVGMGYVFVTLTCGLLLLICCCCIRREADKWQQYKFGLARSSDSRPTRLDSSYDRICPEPGKSIEMKDMKPVSRTPDTSNSLRRKPLRSKSKEQLQDENRNGTEFQRNLKKPYAGENRNREQGTQVQREVLIPGKSQRRTQRKPKEEMLSSEEEELSSEDEDDVKKVPSDTESDSDVKGAGDLGTDTDAETGSIKSDLVVDEYGPEKEDLYAMPRKGTQKPKTNIREVHKQDKRPLKQKSDKEVTTLEEEVKNQNKKVRTDLPKTEPDGKEEYKEDCPPDTGNEVKDSHNPKNAAPSVQPRPVVATRSPPHGPSNSRHLYQPQVDRPLHGGHPQYVSSSQPQTNWQSVPQSENPYPIAPPPYQLTPRYPRYTPRPAPRQHQTPVFSYLVNRGYHPADQVSHPHTSAYPAPHERLPPSDDPTSANIDSGVEIMRR